MVPETCRSRGRPRKDEGPDPDHILNAAITAFATYGWEGTHLRQVAETAGVDAALIARRYDGKMGLWRAIVDHVSLKLVHAFAARTTSPDATPEQRLTHAIDAFVRLNLTMPDLGRFFIDHIARPGERRDYAIAKMWVVFCDAMTPIVIARDPGKTVADPRLYIATLLGAIAMPLMMRSIALGDLTDPDVRDAFTANILALFAKA